MGKGPAKRCARALLSQAVTAFVLTVLSAWGIALWAPRAARFQPVVVKAGPVTLRGSVAGTLLREHWMLQDPGVVSPVEGEATPPPWVTLVRGDLRLGLSEAFGFPMRSLVQHQVTDWGAGGGVLAYHDSWIGRIGGWGFQLPIVPVWPGFVVNWLCHWVVVAVLEQVARCGVRRLRDGRGRCSACGYSRAGLAAGAACPECGGSGASSVP